MPKRFSAKEVVKSLENMGFMRVSQRGSHVKMRGIMHGKLQTAIVPNHKQIAIGTLASILRQANITKQELEDNL